MEFSKKIMVVAVILTIAINIFACVMVCLTRDLTPLAYMLVADGGALGTGYGFYSWKSKNDNRHKYAMKYVDLIAEKYGIEMAARFAEIVLKE